MAHGLPDEANVKGLTTAVNLQDLGELAARLRSPVIFDRRGQVFVVSDFKMGLDGFDISTNGAGSEVALYAKYDNHYGPVLRLYAVNSASSWAQLVRYVGGLEQSLLSLGLSLAISSTFLTIEFNITVRRSNIEYTYQWLYDGSDDTLQVLVSGSTYETVITNLRIDQEYYRFNYVRFTIDDENGLYHEVLINQTAYDLSAYEPPTASVPAGDYITVSVKANGSGAEDTELFLESFILTLGE